MRVVLAVLLASAFLVPAVAAQEPVTSRHERVSERCSSLIPGDYCGLHAAADWTVESCNALNCTVFLEMEAQGWMHHAGLLRIETFSYAHDDGCERTDTRFGSLSDTACWLVCRDYEVSHTIDCSGSKTQTVPVAAGECARYWVATHFFNELTQAQVGMMFFNYLCRTSDGIPYFVS